LDIEDLTRGPVASGGARTCWSSENLCPEWREACFEAFKESGVMWDE
jgi:hypothetical protein